MKWRSLSSWKKGGIILFGINLLLFLIGFILPKGEDLSWSYLFQLPSIMIFEALNEIINFRIAYPIYEFFSLIVGSIFYFIIGALIGLIIGKIKIKEIIH